MFAVRAPQSKPARTAFSILRAHQGDGVERDDGRLAVAERLTGQKGRRPVAAQIRHNHPVAPGCQQGGDVNVAVNVVGPAVQENDRRAVGWAGLRVRDVQETGVDLFQWTKG